MENIESDKIAGLLSGNVFGKLRSGLECNAILIRASEPENYALLYKDGSITIERKILQPYIDETDVSKGGRLAKICNYELTHEFLLEGHENNSLNFYFFNTKKNERANAASKEAVSHSVSTTLVGFCFVIIKKEGKTGYPYMYIDAICAKSGLGGKIIDLMKDLASKLKYPKIELTALDKPIAFYMHKGFGFVPGKNTGELENPLNLFKTITKDGEEYQVLNKELSKFAAFENPKGTVVSFDNRSRTFPHELKKKGIPTNQFNKFRNKTIPKKLSLLTGIKVNNSISGTNPKMYFKISNKNSVAAAAGPAENKIITRPQGTMHRPRYTSKNSRAKPYGGKSRRSQKGKKSKKSRKSRKSQKGKKSKKSRKANKK